LAQGKSLRRRERRRFNSRMPVFGPGHPYALKRNLRYCAEPRRQLSNPRGEDARAVKRVKFKLHDKLGALDKLGRHLGLFDAKRTSRISREAITDDCPALRYLTKPDIAAAIAKRPVSAELTI
jgi:hypothetical protein